MRASYPPRARWPAHPVPRDDARTMGENERKAAIATGIAVICAMFGIESTVAHHHAPSPLSWLVWTVLGAVGGASALMAIVYRRRAKGGARGR